MSGPVTLIACAVEAELKPVARRLGLQRADPLHGSLLTYEGTRQGRCVFAFATGMGGPRAADALRGALDRIHAASPPPEGGLGGKDAPVRVIIAGLCGGLRSGLSVGTVIRPTHIVDADSGESLQVPPSPSAEPPQSPVTLVTLSHVVTRSAEKRDLAERFDAHAADMESAALARLCIQRRLDWSCIKVVSDPVGRDLPPYIANLVDARGRPRITAAALSLLRYPSSIPALFHLARCSARAARILADQLARDI